MYLLFYNFLVRGRIQSVVHRSERKYASVVSLSQKVTLSKCLILIQYILKLHDYVYSVGSVTKVS